MGPPLQQRVSIASAGCLQVAGYMLALVVGAAFVLMCLIPHKKLLPWPWLWANFGVYSSATTDQRSWIMKSMLVV